MNEKVEKCEIEDKAENGSQDKSEYGEAKRKEDNSEYGGGSNEHKVPELGLLANYQLIGHILLNTISFQTMNRRSITRTILTAPWSTQTRLPVPNTS